MKGWDGTWKTWVKQTGAEGTQSCWRRIEGQTHQETEGKLTQRTQASSLEGSDVLGWEGAANTLEKEADLLPTYLWAQGNANKVS